MILNKKSYYAFYIDTFDWGITTNPNAEGDFSYLWQKCDTFLDAKKVLIEFFDERIEDNKRMKTYTKKLKNRLK